MIRSLRGRVFAATLAASIAAVGIALLIGVFTTRAAIHDSYRDEVVREANVVATQLAMVSADGQTPPLGATGLGAGDPNAPGRPPGRTGAPGGPGGRGAPLPRVIGKDAVAKTLPASAVKELLEGDSVTGTVTRGPRRQIFAAVPVQGKDLVVIASRPDSVQSGDFSGYLTGLILAALIAAALSAAAAAFIARRLTKPISDVVAASSDLAAGRTPERLEVPETAELAELATSFNNMADQLARAREAERTVLMSASHELRTPLTAISGYAEGIQDGTIDAEKGSAVIVSESQRLERLVQDLLVLARLEQGTFETREEVVDLAEVAETARARLALRADEAQISLQVTSLPGASALCDSDRVLQIVTNLVDNAVRVTPAGGTVTVEAAPGRIVVRDTGPGIPSEDLPHVFERFHLRKRRGMGSPDGSGIGLAIARELSEAMGGSVSVASEEGQGAEFTVSLKQAPAGAQPA